MVIQPDKSTGFDWNGLIDPMVIKPDKPTGFDYHCLIDPTH
jgi:hypothetical protein